MPEPIDIKAKFPEAEGLAAMRMRSIDRLVEAHVPRDLAERAYTRGKKVFEAFTQSVQDNFPNKETTEKQELESQLALILFYSSIDGWTAERSLMMGLLKTCVFEAFRRNAQ